MIALDFTADFIASLYAGYVQHPACSSLGCEISKLYVQRRWPESMHHGSVRSNQQIGTMDFLQP